VVDYAAQRSAWLSDAILRLSQRSHGAPVRVLVLERAACGPWWDTIQRLNRFEESRLVNAAAYARPRELGGLSRDQICALITDVAQKAGAALWTADVEDIADHAARIDPAGRPLFAVIAALDWLDGNLANASRDTALRRMLARLDAQTSERLAGCLPPGRIRNLRTLATVLGGVTAAGYEQILQRLHPPPGLLPGVFDDYGQVPLDELAGGVQPDILGELYVLDRLGSGDTEHHATTALLRLAWQASPDAYLAFAERTAADHCEHPHLVDLLDVGDWRETPVACARIAADIVPLLRRSDHPALEPVFTRLTSLQDACRQRDVDEIVATARLAFANLVRTHEPERANTLYADLLAGCDPAWPVHADILSNRGITWLSVGEKDAAAADFTAVIDAATATDEARACALNNRAEIHEGRGDIAAAIADRSAVLSLAGTAYDRRYIAYSGRARNLWQLGERDAAMRDIDAILSAPDIVMEQKMAARLQRAQWLMPSAPASATADLETVVASVRNFPAIANRARLLLANRHFLLAGMLAHGEGKAVPQPEALAILHYVIALEALLADGQQCGLYRMLSQHAAILTGRNDAERLEIRQLVCGAYEARSHYVHLGKSDKISKIHLAKLHWIVRRCILTRLSLDDPGTARPLHELADRALFPHPDAQSLVPGIPGILRAGSFFRN
jgi:tetratricopeptide (TPR) repeat protein